MEKVERIKLNMADPVFAPGSTKVAKAPITVSPAGLSCAAEVFLGLNPTQKVATSGLKTFTSTGTVQMIAFPITMPDIGGFSYHVYIDVFADGYLVVAYIATEDVIIPLGEVGPPTWE